MTLKCIAGIEKPDIGEIVLNNRILFNSKKKINLLPQNRKVGLLFQNYALFPNMTLRENIAIGVPKGSKNKWDIVKEKIEAFSLEGLENNYPHQLSGGQQQRVALARMLVNKPDILMLDEPFSALDEHLRWQMEQELIHVLKEHLGSALYVSHNKEEIYRICDKVVVINDGKIEEINHKEILFNNPKTLNSAILTGCDNISRIKKISKNKVYAIDWNLELVCDEAVKNDIKYIGIHKHNISFCTNSQLENVFSLYIKDIIEKRFSYILVLTNKDKRQSIYLELSKEEFNNQRFNIMESIYVQLNSKDLLLLV